VSSQYIFGNFIQFTGRSPRLGVLPDFVECFGDNPAGLPHQVDLLFRFEDNASLLGAQNSFRSRQSFSKLSHQPKPTSLPERLTIQNLTNKTFVMAHQ
jgi:hypothetical protein